MDITIKNVYYDKEILLTIFFSETDTEGVKKNLGIKCINILSIKNKTENIKLGDIKFKIPQYSKNI